jgi:hypothetical protein
VTRGVRIELPIASNTDYFIAISDHHRDLSGLQRAVFAARRKEVVFAVIACSMAHDESRYLVIPLLPFSSGRFGRLRAIATVDRNTCLATSFLDLKGDRIMWELDNPWVFKWIHVDSHWTRDWSK